MMRHLFFCLLLLLANRLLAQDAVSDFAKVDQTFSSANSISMDVTYKFYPTHTSTTPNEIKKGIYRKKGNMLFSQLLGIDILQNANLLVAVDNVNKMVIISPPKALPAVPNEMQLTEVLKSCSSIKREVIGKEVKYSMGFDGKNFECDKLEVYLDADQTLISRIVFYFKQDLIKQSRGVQEDSPRQKMEIQYSSVKLSANIDDSFFSESKYLTEKNGVYQCNSQFKDYKLIDQKSK